LGIKTKFNWSIFITIYKYEEYIVIGFIAYINIIEPKINFLLV